jgi:hypothetical protein
MVEATPALELMVESPPSHRFPQLVLVCLSLAISLSFHLHPPCVYRCAHFFAPPPPVFASCDALMPLIRQTAVAIVTIMIAAITMNKMPNDVYSVRKSVTVIAEKEKSRGGASPVERGGEKRHRA